MRISTKQIRREQYWLDSPTHNSGDNPLMGRLRRALNQLATGIFEHAHHYVFELTQNADDNRYTENTDRFLKFVLLNNDPTETPRSQGCLCVLNDETGFEKKHVESLCDIGNSTKQGNREGYIGEKGIGFKSVFLISNRPHVISNGYSFHFRRDDCDAGLGYIVPHWDEKITAVTESIPTAILLPLRGSSGVDVAKQLADVEPECILFLRKLQRIELVAAHTGLNRTMHRSGTDGFVALESDGTRTSYFVHRAEHSCSHIHEPLREGVCSTSVTVALPLSTPDATDGRVFAFLPTEARTGFPFLINADFLLPASRERIFDTPEWNKQLVKFAAATFVEAFDGLRDNANHRTLAYRFIPVKTDLFPGASLFAPLMESVQTVLREKKCILTKVGDFILPADAYFAEPLSRRLLSESPSRLADFRLVHSDLENHRKRLEPLGVQTLTIPQVLDICADADWLRARDTKWWETLFELLSQYNVSVEVVASFPLLRCQDGVCRRPSDRTVFIQAEGQQAPLTIPPEWPAAHIFDTDLQKRLQQKPIAWAWLSRVVGLRLFSVQAYITGSLLNWMCSQTGEHAAKRIVAATHFIATNISKPEEHRQTLQERMPWLLADERVLLSEDRSGKELVTPECLEGDLGWNWVFISAQDRQHFWLLSDAYIGGQPVATKDSVRKLMMACGATGVPDPARIRRHDGRVDWGCPRWLRDLDLQQAPQNMNRKVAALEHWIGGFKPDVFARFLTLDTDEKTWLGNQNTLPSELGTALRIRPWLHSTKGLVSPPVAFVNDPEVREFLRDSVAYSLSKLHAELLEKLGTHLRLSAATLINLLRQIRDGGNVDEGLVVRIYRRLQTLEFDTGIFRTEALIFLARPTPQWMQAERVFWNDAGDVFDEYFGYAALTYENEDLRGFFIEKLGVCADVPEQQLSEVWAQMSSGDLLAPDVVEKRLNMILGKLARVVSTGELPEWWIQIKPHLKVWTAARRFDVPGTVYAPDDTFAEGIFAGVVRIAWKPKEIASATLNRLLDSLGCLSLARNLRSRVAHTLVTQSNGDPKFLTPASKELLLCWVCAADGADGWSNKRQQLEQLLKTDEAQVTELRIEYWLDGDATPVSSDEDDAFWSSHDQRLCLRQNATAKAQQAAAAMSIAAQFGRHGKQGEDTVYRLLGLESVDARRELAERKWELIPQQKAWLQSVGYRSEIVELTTKATNQDNRESRPPIPPEAPSGGSVAATPQQNPAPESQASDQLKSDAQSAKSPPESSPPDAGITRSPGKTDDRNEPPQLARSTESEPNSSSPLKSPDAEAEFIHVNAHTRRQPGREPQKGEAGDRETQGQHPMAGVSHATKTEIENAAVQVILQQFQRVPGLRGFKVHDERKRNHGYDVLAIKPGHVLRIEIKAHLREAKSVFVTQKEWQQSKRHAKGPPEDHWELWNVENLAGDTPGKVRIIRYQYLPDDAFRESGYWVDLNACHSESIQ
ncbi:MAG: DUF3883 domain-containing protein [Verrucomicrobiota bacterium]